MALFEDDFSVNHLAEYVLQFEDEPGTISEGHLTGNFDYVEPTHPVVAGGRVAALVLLEHDTRTNQSLVGVSTPDVASTASAFFRLVLRDTSFDALVAVSAAGLHGFSLSKEGNPPLTGPVWMSCELSADLKSLHGGVWSSRPPAEGGTPDILGLVATGEATGHINPAEMYPYIGGTPNQNARYDDWWAMVEVPEPPRRGPGLEQLI